jgi:hypothetical protein
MKRNALMRNLAISCLLASGLPAKGQTPVDNTTQAPPAPLTHEELADPPVGKIRGIHLRALKQFDADIQKRIDKSSGAKDGTRFAAILHSLKTKARKAVGSLNKEDLFDVIHDMVSVYQEPRKENIPEDDDGFTYIERANHTVQSLNVPLLKSMAEHISENQGSLTDDLAEKFTTVFLVKGFIFAYDWEEEPIPIGEADVYVANPSAVVKRLKACPWQRVQDFIGDNSNRMVPQEFFSEFEPNGGGMPVLKAKYLANKAAIWAEFDEIKNWVIQQERQAQGQK